MIGLLEYFAQDPSAVDDYHATQPPQDNPGPGDPDPGRALIRDREQRVPWWAHPR